MAHHMTIKAAKRTIADQERIIEKLKSLHSMVDMTRAIEIAYETLDMMKANLNRKLAQ